MTQPTAPKALCLHHDHGSAPGLVGDAFADLCWQVETRFVVPPDRFDDPGVRFEFPDPAGYDLLVPFGAPWSVYDTALIGSWVEPELQWLAQAHEVGTPVLGVCFGGQLLAASLGGSVTRGETAEVGWHDVDSDRPEIVPPGPWFQWHYDRFSLPEGATAIARNAATTQAFVHGRSMGLQFHPELTPAILSGWLATGGDAKARALGIEPADLMTTTTDRVETSAARTRTLIQGYLTHVLGSAGPSEAHATRGA
jgi:GMP synthase-like glutamine amidotransferase